MTDDDGLTAPEFLCVTMYAEDISPLRAYYHEALGLPIDYEESGPFDCHAQGVRPRSIRSSSGNPPVVLLD